MEHGAYASRKLMLALPVSLLPGPDTRMCTGRLKTTNQQLSRRSHSKQQGYCGPHWQPTVCLEISTPSQTKKNMVRQLVVVRCGFQETRLLATWRAVGTVACRWWTGVVSEVCEGYAIAGMIFE